MITRSLTRPLTGAITRSLSQAGAGGFTVTPTAWTDTALAVDQGDYIETSPLARAVFETDATEITVRGYCNIFASYPLLAEIGVIVDGEFLQSVVPTATGAFSETISGLAAGAKTVELVNGATTRIGGTGTVLGTWLKSVSANAAITQTFPTATNVTLFLADSIGVGANADTPTQYSYIARLRKVTTDSLVVYGWGFNQMSTVAGDSTKRAALMAIISALAPARVVDTLGTNDWALTSSTVTNLGDYKAALYDDIHTALPSAGIFAVKMSIRRAADEVDTNGFGFTPDQYRAAFDTAATGRAWVTVVNGKAFMTDAALDDDVHPTTYGHLLWAQGIDGSLGYAVPDDPIAYDPVNAGPDATGTVTDLGGGAYQIEKTSGSNGFNTGFYGEPRAGDFRYQIDTSVASDVMFGVSSAAETQSGFADMTHQLYITAGSNMSEYNGATSAGATSPSTRDSGTAGRIWIDRTGTALTFKMGVTYAGATTLISKTLSGTVGLDVSLFQVGGKHTITVVV